MEETEEDKILVGARREKLEPMELVDKYTKEFLEDMDALGVERPNVQPRATGHMVEIIEATKQLIEKGYAYVVDGTVYFDISKFKDYGKLSKIKPKELKKHRIEPDPRKRNPADFALWKLAEPGHILRWASPWGEGYPGWHIECSVMGLKYLGEQFDIHGGARDLVFPHHENEIAQSEALTGKSPFVKYWLHTGLLTVHGQRMAKSLGNFIPIKDTLKNYDAETFRFFVLSAHYRSPIDYSEKSLKEAKESLEKLYLAMESVRELKKTEELSKEEKRLSDFVDKAREKFLAAMDDDFNTPLAISHLFSLAGEVNRFVARNKQINEKLAEKIVKTFKELGGILGILQQEKVVEERTKKLVELLIELRQKFRGMGDFKTSDAIRSKLRKVGIILEDVPEGTKWRVE
jgi:cysteinyl-tRNA synthetase